MTNSVVTNDLPEATISAGVPAKPARGALPPPTMATVSSQPRGGVYDGDKLSFTVALEGGSWRIDSVVSSSAVGPDPP